MKIKNKFLMILSLSLTILFSSSPCLASTENTISLEKHNLTMSGLNLNKTSSKDDLKIELNDLTKKGTVVVFLSAKCPCSNSHISELSQLSKAFSDFKFVGVHSNLEEDLEFSQKYFANADLPFPVIKDVETKIADVFKAHKTPHSFVVLPDGKIAYQGGVSSSRSFDSADRKFLREALEDLQQGKTVRTPEGRTLGCAISRGQKNVW